ncbi:uncharacterized mitochondrial protein AtMg00810-like [Arachis stenosperma]|uniref:uncharacterized mitochondrial protein AtMg00810-like n=1 Tax=Arachis stenosperma TaxID=217475 RepID=UPI0025AC6414|nr:uncharacterized mitochondrial protein AtMg00810-like [Arachis stenosperma]
MNPNTGCRPFIGLDGTFLKGFYGGQLLTAIGQDANNQNFPITYAVVDSEITENGFWSIYTMTWATTRFMGLIPTMQQVMPGVYHRFLSSQIGHIIRYRATWPPPLPENLLRPQKVYVDNILVTSNNKNEITALMQKLHGMFALKSIGTFNYFLEIEATKLKSGAYHLSQTKYIKYVLHKSSMIDAKSVPTPVITSKKFSKHGAEYYSDPTHYLSIVRALQYYTFTRPEIAFSINKVSQFMQRPLFSHWRSVKRIFRYLAGTTEQGLLFHPSTNLRIFGFADADWSSDVGDRRSASSYCIFLGTNLVAWSKRKQHVVSHFSTESEYRSVAAATTEIIWLQNLLSELGFQHFGVSTIYCDNASAFQLSVNPVIHSRTKHFEFNIHFVRDLVNQHQLHIV